MDWYLDQISNCTYRQFTTGFFFGKPDESAQIYDNNTYVKGIHISGHYQGNALQTDYTVSNSAINFL